MNNQITNQSKLIAIAAVVAVIAGAIYIINMPDKRNAGEKVSDAINQLENRTPGEKFGDAVENMGDDIKDATSSD